MARDVGVDVQLDRVPLREHGMEPWEIMISESQERMVAVVRPERLAEVEAVLSRWELHHAAIGEVNETGELRAFFDDEMVGEIPAAFLTDECPRYEVDRLDAARPRAEVEPVNLEPKEWIYQQYDQLVLSRTVRRPGLDAAVLQLRPSWRGLAVSLDGPPLGCRDPREAGRAAVLAAARNVACAGGEPLALTDCLNFGNPEKPEIGWSWRRRSRASPRRRRRSKFGRLGQTCRFTTRPMGARFRRRPWSGVSASFPTCARCLAAGGPATVFGWPRATRSS
jgi:phosphoribosylformylglycinamidine synthase